MTISIAIVALFVFFASLVWLERGEVPLFLQELSLIKCILLGLICMTLGMGVAVLIHLLYFPVVITILVAQTIAWKSRKALKSAQ